MGEGICRLILSKYVELPSDERNIVYRYDSKLGWFPLENTFKRVFTECTWMNVEHNNMGFRDKVHGEKLKPRIAFFGDSFVWGFDVEQAERFTDIFQEMNPKWEVLNFGVSGYGTDQEYLLIQQMFDYYRPDIVVLVFNDTDFGNNSVNLLYRGYYKPYFATEDDKLVLKGVPVPKSLNYYYAESFFLSKSYLLRGMAKLYYKFFMPPQVSVPDPTQAILKEIKKFANRHGAEFFLGLGPISDKKAYNKLVSFCKENKIGYVDLDNNQKIQGCGYHWNKAGNEIAARKVDLFLKQHEKMGR